jgi:serine protease Do
MEDLSDEQRAERKLDSKSLALFVKHVGEYGEHAKAKNAGFKKEDVLVQIGEWKTRATESEVIGKILQVNAPGAKIPATVLRGGERVKLEIPVQ